MRNLRNWTILVGCVCMFFACPTVSFGQNNARIARFQTFVDSLNSAFSTPGISILDSADVANFKGIPFFSYDPKFCVKAKVKRIKNGKPEVLLTSGERRPVYIPIAKIKFSLEGKKQSLTLYINQNPSNPKYADHVMLAFTDLTNGFETYGGGRYLDFELSDLDDELVVDFNFAYNPYCAYAHRFSCVIPPKQNQLEIPVRAGAMANGIY